MNTFRNSFYWKLFKKETTVLYMISIYSFPFRLNLKVTETAPRILNVSCVFSDSSLSPNDLNEKIQTLWIWVEGSNINKGRSPTDRQKWVNFLSDELRQWPKYANTFERSTSQRDVFVRRFPSAVHSSFLRRAEAKEETKAQKVREK